MIRLAPPSGPRVCRGNDDRVSTTGHPTGWPMAPNNKSRTAGKATKPQRTFDCKVQGLRSDDDFAQAFGPRSTVPVGTRPVVRGAQSNERRQNEATLRVDQRQARPRWTAGVGGLEIRNLRRTPRCLQRRARLSAIRPRGRLAGVAAHRDRAENRDDVEVRLRRRLSRPAAVPTTVSTTGQRFKCIFALTHSAHTNTLATARWHHKQQGEVQ